MAEANGEQTVQHSPSGSSTASAACAVETRRELPQPLDRKEVPDFLASYDYFAQNAYEWSGDGFPELALGVSGHTKIGHQTYYQVDCVLAKKEESVLTTVLAWNAPRRLAQLQQSLHAPVKQGLDEGAGYKAIFDGVHFAHIYAGPGTTARLHAWCQKLAQVINSKQASPMVVASALRALGVVEASSRTELNQVRTGYSDEISGYPSIPSLPVFESSGTPSGTPSGSPSGPNPFDCGNEADQNAPDPVSAEKLGDRSETKPIAETVEQPPSVADALAEFCDLVKVTNRRQRAGPPKVFDFSARGSTLASAAPSLAAAPSLVAGVVSEDGSFKPLEASPSKHVTFEGSTDDG